LCQCLSSRPSTCPAGQIDVCLSGHSSVSADRELRREWGGLKKKLIVGKTMLSRPIRFDRSPAFLPIFRRLFDGWCLVAVAALCRSASGHSYPFPCFLVRPALSAASFTSLMSRAGCSFCWLLFCLRRSGPFFFARGSIAIRFSLRPGFAALSGVPFGRLRDTFSFPRACGSEVALRGDSGDGGQDCLARGDVERSVHGSWAGIGGFGSSDGGFRVSRSIGLHILVV
jgi:hypothetical protein